jgi:alpha-amylase/alpha-mannosidase (GH57 family)/ribosomal protein S18 acetylase RimI-like enzyme
MERQVNTQAGEPVMTERYLCVHGHFYQPPRQNPWLEEMEAEPSAAPFHDWNERITAECYAPNAAARIVDGEDRVLEIHNNYTQISFNFGPTLLAWLEKADPTTYQQIIAADRLSRANRGGHGNAIAQAYNHVIMPLANRRDKVTQVVWGIGDFQRRFGRDPEGMWLPETAVDLETLDILAEHGMRFTILSPFQAKRVRMPRDKTWSDASNGRIDPSRPYRCLLPSGRDIALFFYDGPIAKAIAFDGVLARGEMLIERLMGGFHDGRNHTQLVQVATDGETYGHHHRFGEMALAYALSTIARKKLARLTNYGQYLERFPPDQLVEIAEDTSWSCAHGIERWRSDCGCQTGGKPGWHQRWRQPLREALDWLRDQLAQLFEDEGGKLLNDPWAARDSYITVILDRSHASVERFFQQQARRRLSDAEVIQALKLLEMQRHALLMYTSCAWFFAEISRIETVQMLAYAARAIQLAREVAGLELEPGFLERLAAAPSNLPQFTENGRDVYLKLVRPKVATLRTVIANYAISALIEPEVPQQTLGVYDIQEVGAHRDSRGSFTLTTGRVRVQSQLMGESLQAIYAALGSDGHDFRCSVKGYVDTEEYTQSQDELFRLFTRHSLTEVVRALDAHFGEEYFTLSHLFPDEQRRIGQQLLAKALERFEQHCEEVYRTNQRLIDFVRTRDLPLPDVLRTAAQSSLNAEINLIARQLLAEQLTPGDAAGIIRTHQHEAKRLQCTLTFDQLNRAYEAIIEHHIAFLPQEAGHAQLPRQALEVAQELKLGLNLWRAQNLFWHYLTGETYTVDLPVMLELGTRLGFNQAVVSKLLDASPATPNPVT